jgi:hypothetical protein
VGSPECGVIDSKGAQGRRSRRRLSFARRDAYIRGLAEKRHGQHDYDYGAA